MMVFRGKRGKIIIVSEMGERELFPTGRCSARFCWGKGGPCAGETAYAILSVLFGRKIAESYHSSFKWDVVARLPSEFALPEEKIRRWMIKARRKHFRDMNIWFNPAMEAAL